MYSTTKYLFITMLAFIIATSCNKDMDTILPPIDNIPEPITKVSATIYGVILDEDNQAINEASVQLGLESTLTDINGYFKLTGFFNNQGAYMQVMKEGYYDGHGTVVPYADLSVGTKMILKRKANPYKDLSGNKIIHTTANHIVEFTAGSFTKDGNPYSGNVSIYSSYSVRSHNNFSYIHPGLMDVQNSTPRKALRPFAILNLELYDDSNNLLNINAPALIALSIDPELVSVAPEEVPLWYLDTDSGQWIEDGLAIKQGSQYIAVVSHFTMWACALDYGVYSLSGNITRNGVAYPNANLGLSITNSSYVRRFRAASDGSYETFILGISDRDFIVYDNCDEPIYTINIPTPTADVVQDVDLSSTANSYEVSGFVYCDNTTDKISNSYVVLNYDNSAFTDYILTDAAGNFDFSYDDCNNQAVSLSAYDPASASLSAPTTLTGSNTNLEIDVCDMVLSSSLIFKVDGEPDYVIEGCLVEVIDVPFPPSYTYKFMATDFFSSSGTQGEFVKYEVSYNHQIPGEFAPPVGPPWNPASQPGALSSNPPVYFEIDAPWGIITSETADKVFWETDTSSSPVVTKRWVNGVVETVSAHMVIEAIKI